jgi:choline dehydrogenase-like flavoprotein
MSLMDHIETDICVIGSGVAGGIVARECSGSGRDVLVLEAGKRVTGRPLAVRLMERGLRDFRMPRMLWHRRSRYGSSEYRNVGNQRYPLRGLALNTRGGSILGWIGTAYRLRPEDFRLHSTTGQGIDWPISYAELEPHYAAAEATLRVAGDHRDEGHPPRSAPFPLLARPYHERDDAFLDLLADRGWPPMHHNISLAPDGGAFTLDDLLDDLESRSNVKLLTRSPVTRILCTSRSRAEGVECIDLDSGEPFKVYANAIVVCAGGIETPTLLQRSANELWPTGLGDHSGHLGHNLISHIGIVVGGRPKRFRFFNGPIGSTVATRHFDSEGEQGSGKYLLLWYPSISGYLFLKVTMELFPNAANSVSNGPATSRFGMPKPTLDFNYDDRALAREDAIHDRLRSLAAQMGMGISHQHRYVNAHPMCTARMSTDPRDGVIDSELRVHAMDNLYVCGSASFSTGGAANPTLTIAALAHRLGRHLSNGGPISRATQG